MESLLSQRIATVAPSFIREILRVAQQPGVISFAGGLPNPALFPTEALAAAFEAVLSGEAKEALQYTTTEGHTGLREWIAARYRQRHGLEVPVESILITNGSQQALDLLGKVLLDPGDGVLFEEPGYLGALQALSLYQPRFLPIPLHADGPDPELAAQAIAQPWAKLFYTVPNFQNPSGMSYPTEARYRLAARLAGRRQLLIEDDPYGELRFRGGEAPSFATLLPEQTVLLGSLSKTVAPSLRLGWVVAPPWLMRRLVIAKQAGDLHSSGLLQRVVHRYLCDNDFNAHLAQISAHYGRQCEAMLTAAEHHLAPQLSCRRPDGGMFLWATLPQGWDAMALFERAITAGVAFVPGATFHHDGRGRNTLRLNFTHSNEVEIDEGIRRLGEALSGMEAGPSTGGTT